MSLVLAIDDLKPEQVKYAKPGRTGSTDTIFFKASSDKPDTPTAFVVEYVPGRLSGAHYHAADQFQILVRGKGTLGRHDMSPYCVHFARAFTPYGPLRSDHETGWAFLTLRTRYDPGKQSFPAAQDKLKKIQNRRPWQITKKVTIPVPGSGVSLQDVSEIKDEQGLFVCSLAMAPHTRTTAPDPSVGDGQYVVVVKGSLIYDNREHKALTIVFIKPLEDRFQIEAGADGLEGLILNFPQVTPRAPTTATPSTVAEFKKWQCVLCSFAYDEAKGMPEEGIAAGTRWQDVPDNWSCPDCSASKSDFEMVEA